MKTKNGGRAQNKGYIDKGGGFDEIKFRQMVRKTKKRLDYGGTSGK